MGTSYMCYKFVLGTSYMCVITPEKSRRWKKFLRPSESSPALGIVESTCPRQSRPPPGTVASLRGASRCYSPAWTLIIHVLWTLIIQVPHTTPLNMV